VATHYDVLGVAPDAVPADIRRAYLELARALHPDRAVGSSAGESQRSSRRMQEVNEAWRVLREPASRAAYDRALVPAAPPVPSDVDPMDVPFSAAAPVGDIGVSFVRALPWFAVAVVLVAIFIFTAFASGQDSARGPQDLVGRCVSPSNVSSVAAVSCEEPNDGQVVLVVDRASLCPDGSAGRPVAGNRWLCLEPVRSPSSQEAP